MPLADDGRPTTEGVQGSFPAGVLGVPPNLHPSSLLRSFWDGPWWAFATQDVNTCGVKCLTDQSKSVV
jgi:hypothetical protein